MSIKDMEVFARVVAIGNMSSAGREMGLSPAVVSKRISQLEKRLGACLIQRTTRQLSLTEIGEGYHERILEVLDNINAAEEFVTKDHLQPRGVLRIVAPTIFGRLHITPQLPEFLQSYPDLKINLNLSDEKTKTSCKNMDIIINTAQSEENSSFVSHKLIQNSCVLVASPSYLDNYGTPQSLKDLKKHNCLSDDNHNYWEFFHKNNSITFKVKSRIATNSNEVILENILKGYGISYQSTSNCGDYIKSHDLRIVMPNYREKPTSAIYATYKKREFIPAKIELFIKFMKSKIGHSMPYWNNGIDFSE